MILGTHVKQPSEVLDYDIDYSDWLPSGDDISSAAVTAETGITVDSSTVVGQRVKIWMSGGTNGTTYKVTCKATTDAGRVKEAEIKIKVKEF